MKKPLTADDFPDASLTREAARASVPDLPDAAFDGRWQRAVGDPLTMLRSFPSLWWRDVRSVDPARVPAGRTLGFGDAHVENFGFLTFDDGRVGYAFNDLDDSGEVEVALDALRYFVSVALWRGAPAPKEGVAGLVERWARALDKAQDPVLDRLSLDPGGDPPKPAKMRRKALERWSTEDLPKIDEEELEALRVGLAAMEETRDHAVVAARRRTVLDGGSGGLARFWALVRKPGDDELDIFELKARAPAAASQGARAVPVDKRLSTMKKVMWPGRSLTPYHRLDLRLGGAKSFVVRSRGVRAPFKAPPADDPKAQRFPYGDQVRILAAVHGRAAGAASSEELADWVAGSVSALVARWTALAAR